MADSINNIGFRLRALKERMGIGMHPLRGNAEHLSAAIDWLRRAQDATPDGGVSQTYFVKRRCWANSYPETTGYIIPTFYRFADLMADADVRERARRMVDWECDIQLPDGGVIAGAIGDSNQPTVFNTGQVLFGWVRGYEVEGDERYREAAVRAANWLLMAQDDDGCWRRFGSPMTSQGVNTYNTRSAWALTRIHAITHDRRYFDGAVKNCIWALTQRNERGWLDNNCLLDKTRPFVHTIAYAMRGLLEVGDYGERQDFLDAAIRIGDAILNALTRNGFLAGRFDASWRQTVPWSCLTGNAQIAVNWGRLYQITGEERYKDAVVRINSFTKRTQKLEGIPEERGGIKGSHPITGGYHPWQYPNWATKFFADALMMEMEIVDSKNKTGLGFPG